MLLRRCGGTNPAEIFFKAHRYFRQFASTALDTAEMSQQLPSDASPPTPGMSSRPERCRALSSPGPVAGYGKTVRLITDLLNQMQRRAIPGQLRSFPGAPLTSVSKPALRVTPLATPITSTPLTLQVLQH